MRIAVLGSGHGSNLQSLVDHAARGQLGATIVLACSDRPDAKFLVRARAAGIPSVPLAWPDCGPLLRLLEDHQVDAVVLAGFMRILPARFINQFDGPIVNIHPSLLPAFPGLRAVRQALQAGAPATGCTTHFVNAGVDSGQIIMQATVLIRTAETEESLVRRVLALEHEVLPATVRLVASGAVCDSA